MSVFQGPFDVTPFPSKLNAAVVTPETSPLVHGYPLLLDLANQRGFTETVWLALKGELPNANDLWVFERALYWMSPIHVGEAPAHAAIVSRVCDSWTSSTVMVGAVGLAERSRVLQKEFAPWFDFLAQCRGRDVFHDDIPSIAIASSNDEEIEQARAVLFAELEERFGKSKLFDPSINYRREAVAFLLLHTALLLEPLIIDFLSVWSALPLLIAEAKNVKPGDVASYPARIPEINYVES